MAWAIVALGHSHRHRAVLEVLAEELRHRFAARKGTAPLPQHRCAPFSSQECANVAWAFATARLGGAVFFDFLSQEFLADVTRPLQNPGRGRDWVAMIDAVHR